MNNQFSDPIQVTEGELCLYLEAGELLMIPFDAVESSSFHSMGKRLADLLNAIDGVSNGTHCRGELYKRGFQFRDALVVRLRKEGWKVEISPTTDMWTVRPTPDIYKACADIEAKKLASAKLQETLAKVLGF